MANQQTYSTHNNFLTTRLIVSEPGDKAGLIFIAHLVRKTNRERCVSYKGVGLDKRRVRVPLVN